MQTTLKINGMTCMGCVRSVTNVLTQLPGVSNVTVSLEQGQATVEHDASKSDVAALKQAVIEAGYEAV